MYETDWGTVGAIGVDLGLAGHHSAVVALEGNRLARKLRVVRVVDIGPPTRLEFVKDSIVRMATQYNTRAIFMDAWQGIRLAEELQAMGFTVIAEHQTGPILTRQAGALLQASQDEVLELYRGGDGDLLIRDLYRVQDRREVLRSQD